MGLWTVVQSDWSISYCLLNCMDLVHPQGLENRWWDDSCQFYRWTSRLVEHQALFSQQPCEVGLSTADNTGSSWGMVGHQPVSGGGDWDSHPGSPAPQPLLLLCCRAWAPASELWILFLSFHICEVRRMQVPTS